MLYPWLGAFRYTLKKTYFSKTLAHRCFLGQCIITPMCFTSLRCKWLSAKLEMVTYKRCPHSTEAHWGHGVFYFFSHFHNSPGRDTNSPGQDSNLPRQDTNSPGQDTNSPGRDTNSPGRDTNSPGQDTNSPGRDTNSPGQDTNLPGQDTNLPGRDRLLTRPGEILTRPGEIGY